MVAQQGNALLAKELQEARAKLATLEKDNLAAVLDKADLEARLAEAKTDIGDLQERLAEGERAFRQYRVRIPKQGFRLLLNQM